MTTTERNRPTPSALRLWQKELLAGKRTTTTFDWLHRAACLDICAEEAERDGLPGIADARRRMAATVIVAGYRGEDQAVRL